MMKREEIIKWYIKQRDRLKDVHDYLVDLMLSERAINEIEEHIECTEAAISALEEAERCDWHYLIRNPGDLPEKENTEDFYSIEVLVMDEYWYYLARYNYITEEFQDSCELYKINVRKWKYI